MKNDTVNGILVCNHVIRRTKTGFGETVYNEMQSGLRFKVQRIQSLSGLFYLCVKILTFCEEAMLLHFFCGSHTR